MCLSPIKRKKKKFCKLADEVFHNFYNDGRLCGEGVKDKGFIENCDCYNINTNSDDVTYKMTINDRSLRLTFKATYYLKLQAVSVWVSTENHENKSQYAKYMRGKYNDKPFSVFVDSGNYGGINIGMKKMPAGDEHQICEALHKFRIAWQESEIHKLLTKIAITDYTYRPKDFHDFD